LVFRNIDCGRDFFARHGLPLLRIQYEHCFPRFDAVTLRSHIYIVNFLFLMGCASQSHSRMTITTQGDERMTALDVGGHGRPDTWRWTKKGEKGEPDELTREEFDLNGDGKVDVHKYYDHGKLSKLTMDLDFDGKIDSTEYFEAGVLTKSEL